MAMEIKQGTASPFDWKICRMEHATTLNYTEFMGVEEASKINPDEHYCYKICLTNISDMHLFDIHAWISWEIKTHPTVGPVGPTELKLLTFVEPYLHAASVVHKKHCCLSNCDLILFRDLKPKERAVSAISFQLHGMHQPSAYEVTLDKIYYTPAEVKQCYIFSPEKYIDLKKYMPIEEHTSD
jgi:hypothetical protein